MIHHYYINIYVSTLKARETKETHLIPTYGWKE